MRLRSWRRGSAVSAWLAPTRRQIFLTGLGAEIEVVVVRTSYQEVLASTKYGPVRAISNPPNAQVVAVPNDLHLAEIPGVRPVGENGPGWDLVSSVGAPVDLRVNIADVVRGDRVEHSVLTVVR